MGIQTNGNHFFFNMDNNYKENVRTIKVKGW